MSLSTTEATLILLTTSVQGLIYQAVNSFVRTSSIISERFNQSTTTMPCSYISTPLNGVDARIVLAALHNHDMMIRTLCPALVSYHLESGDRTTQATYAITDRKPVSLVSSTSSFWSSEEVLTTTQTTYRLTLTNVSGGVDSLVNAKPPVGVLTISGKWRVVGGHLSEEVEIDANFMMKKVAKTSVERTHPEQHVKLLRAARA
jgi:hypothetical protein